MSDRLVALAYALGWRAVRALPERAAGALFRFGADRAYRRGGRGTRRLRANLARVTPPGTDLDALTRTGLRSYARYWMEIFRLQDMPTDRIVGRFYLADEARLRDSHAAGRGTILALPHMGNWDHAGAWLVATGIPFTTVAERLRPAALFDRFVEFRQSLGMEVLPLTGGERPPFEVLAERLRAGGMLCLLADRDLSADGVPVTFFGAPATMPAGPAALVLATGATLLPVTLWFDGDGDGDGDGPGGGWAGQVYPAIAHTDVATMTQELADAFASSIAAHPADWHMLQRVWRDDPVAAAPTGPAVPTRPAGPGAPSAPGEAPGGRVPGVGGLGGS